MDTDIAVSEALSSTTAAGTATVECLVSFGMDPTVAAAIAVLLGVLARLLVDWLQRRLAERRKESSDDPPDDEPPTGAAPILTPTLATGATP